MRRAQLWASVLASGFALAACGGGSDSGSKNLFPEKPECQGDPVAPLMGDQTLVISDIAIGAKADGLDLDGDGEPDNALYGIGDFAKDPIAQSFASYDIVAPVEMFDFPQAAADDCVKFAVYLGAYKMDNDGDGGQTANDSGDCNDGDPDIHKGAAEVAGNFVDDDCDGLADETDQPDGNGGTMTVPSDDTMDRDQDGVTIADGDCDDNDATIHVGAVEVCGDGRDNDCDGNADWGVDGDESPACTPYDPDTPDALALDAQGFNDDGSPVIAFRSGTVTQDGGDLVLDAGPSLFSINFPIADGVNLDMRITGATIHADVVDSAGGVTLKNGQLGGVLDANTIDKVRGLTVEQINLTPDQSLLDAIFANVLGVLLALPRPQVAPELGACMTPDIDVDGDGLEMFCDTHPEDMDNTVDACVDGDGTVVHDEVDAGGNVTVNCTEAVDDQGNLRFVDGVSVELNFDTVPALLPGPLP